MDQANKEQCHARQALAMQMHSAHHNSIKTSKLQFIDQFNAVIGGDLPFAPSRKPQTAQPRIDLEFIRTRQIAQVPFYWMAQRALPVELPLRNSDHLQCFHWRHNVSLLSLSSLTVMIWWYFNVRCFYFMLCLWCAVLCITCLVPLCNRVQILKYDAHVVVAKVLYAAHTNIIVTTATTTNAKRRWKTTIKYQI